ncbi:AAA family ATPase [Undibacterium seohonense]|uniref:AAA family ATPase n=1 Tax=Undibacterium seohonense TaxID=1344950 RepID=A0ABR6X9G1_9BURK|nr:AAA family ATPase [Undibacterium seohonense]MBC3809570.1 AAA family ATPase [Undibacterium seohonense]
MKITDINLKENDLIDFNIDLGFKAKIQMPKLGRLVLLAGQNGSGKSRFLRCISILGNQRDHNENTNTLNIRIKELNTAISNREIQLRNPNNAEKFDEFKANIENWKSEIENSNLRLRKLKAISLSVENERLNPISFVPQSASLQNPEELPPQNLRSYSTLFSELGMKDAHGAAPAYVKNVLQKALFAKIPDNKFDKGDIDLAISARDSLIQLFKKILGNASDPHLTINGEVSFFGRVDYSNTLSEGQKVLFQMTAALHAQDIKLNEAILFLDEPENHLHPAALIEVVSKLNEAITDGQIWIATHSVPLIAYFVYDEPSCLWYVHEGEINHAGRKPELVLEGLLGNVEGTERLRHFTQLPMQLATNRFLAECILPPATVGADVTDPQTNQIRTIVKDILDKKNGTTLRVLDYGAGRGRLLPTLATLIPNSCGWLDYYAFDAFDDDSIQCRNEIEQFYMDRSSQTRYFNSMSDIATKCDSGSVDIIVMCNVLHEVPPESWIEELGTDSYIFKLLQNDGYLLIVEDYGIPTGENAHQHGFLLLNTAELSILFEIKEQDRNQKKYMHFDARSDDLNRKGRLIAHLVHKDLLSRISLTSRVEAIKELQKNSRKKMKLCRNGEPNFKTGQDFALASQLYANSSIWLEENPTLAR